jgi:hypothetical protein
VKSGILSFVGYVLVLSGLAFLFVMAFHGALWLLALIFIPIGLWIICRRARSSTPPIQLGAAFAAFIFVVVAPTVITLTAIKRSAASVAGEKYCLYQEGFRQGSRFGLTRSVSDLSVGVMTGRRSRIFGPPHVTLITPDRTWLWSFRKWSFVPWQSIETANGVPALQESQFIGSPSNDMIAKCFKELAGNLAVRLFSLRPSASYFERAP